MLNFGASKPRVKGGPGPPWIRACMLPRYGRTSFETELLSLMSCTNIYCNASTSELEV